MQPAGSSYLLIVNGAMALIGRQVKCEQAKEIEREVVV